MEATNPLTENKVNNIFKVIQNEFGNFYFINVWCIIMLITQILSIKDSDLYSNGLKWFVGTSIGLIFLNFIHMNYLLYKKYKKTY